MDTQQQIQVLRLHLLDMSKLSQRAVDYAIKGYRLGSPEFCRYVRNGDCELGQLQRRITDMCQKLMTRELAVDSVDFVNEPTVDSRARFTVSAVQICGALQSICTATSEIAHHTMLLLEDARVTASAALEKVCYLVNRFMCLCIIALFKKESQHAETVLQNREIERLFDQAFKDLRNDSSGRITIQAALELAITNSLRQIATKTREFAEAVVFWLEGRKCALESDASAHR
jgi:phosphate uptake regulator